MIVARRAGRGQGVAARAVASTIIVMVRFVIFAVLSVSLVGFFATWSGQRLDVARVELASAAAMRLGGGLVALMALCGMLGLWLRDAGPRRLLPGVVILLGGLAVSNAAWPAVVGLALVSVALVVVVPKAR